MERRESQRHVYRILRCQNHYEVLEIAIDATKEEIVSAYRRWARLVHPDKNSAHQAEEAMKKVTQAKEILTDPAERRRYDQSFMHEEQEPEQPNQNMQDEGDELFNIDRDEERNWWDTQFRIYLLVCLPVILLLLMPGIVSLMQPHPVYSLTPHAKFPIRKRTMGGKIPYYVTKDFSMELQKYYNGALGDLEKDVKYSYRKKLERECKREREYKQFMLDDALNAPNSPYWYERVERAKSITTPSCGKLHFLADILKQPYDDASKIWKYLTFFMKIF